MKSYVSPKYIFERKPNKLDRVIRFGKSVLDTTHTLASKKEHESPALRRMYEADESLRDYGFAFTERWRDILGDRLNNGVLLRTNATDYSIEAYITKDDTLPELPEIQVQYETSMDFTVTQSAGYSTSMRIDTRTRHPREGIIYPEGCVPMIFSSTIAPLRKDGSINSDSWGKYTRTESAHLSEAAVRIMRELDTASITQGALEIIDL